MAAEPSWPYITTTKVAEVTDTVTDIQNAGDGSGRLFLVEQRGRIKIFKNGNVLPTLFLNLDGRLLTWGECGLLGLAFPPGYATKRCFYVFYNKPNGDSVVSRFRLTENPDVADSESGEILFTFPNSSEVHKGGQIAFGPDGYLYISLGDAIQDANTISQNLTSLAGKLLRIDVENTSPGLAYAIPPTNPHAGSNSYRREIIGWGLRNPWRFCFDSANGDLYLSDVGDAQREEINFVPAAAIRAGTNFGWSIKEGTLDRIPQTPGPGPLRPPVFEYSHFIESCVIGGAVYRGANPRLNGFYLFGDYIYGKIWAMDTATKKTRLVMESAGNISTFGQDEAGEIYYAYYGGINRIDSPDTLPSPIFRPVPGTYDVGQPVTITTQVPGAIIRYTTDGSMPVETSPILPADGKITLSGPTQILTRSFRADMIGSTVSGGEFLVRPLAVVFSPSEPDYYYTDYTPVTISSPTERTEIRYTLDGTEPGPNSLLYTQAILLTKDARIIARAYKIGWTPSTTKAIVIRLRVAYPEWLDPWPEHGAPVDLTSKTPGAVFRYTINGKNPDLSSPIWTGPRDLPAGTVVRVLATRGEMIPASDTLTVSPISSATAVFRALGEIHTEPSDVACLSNGSVYAISSSSIQRFENNKFMPILAEHPSESSFTSITATTDSKLATTVYNSQVVSKFSGTAYGKRSNIGTPYVMNDTVAEPGGGLVCISTLSHRVIRLNAAGSQTSVMGTGIAGSKDGPAAQATFYGPSGIARDSSGRIYISDRYGHRIRRIGTDAVVTTLAGTDIPGWVDGPVATARFEAPRSMATDGIGNLYVVDGPYYSRLRKISPDGMVFTVRGPVESINGTLLRNEALGTTTIRGLAVDANGAVHFANDIGVFKVTLDDYDNDGIPDATEKMLGAPFVVGVDDRRVDKDGDLFSNAAEWIVGTNPSSASSKPGLTTAIRKLDDHSIFLHFPMSVGGTRQLQYSHDLATWNSLGPVEPGTFRSFTTRRKFFPGLPARFYRVKEQR